MHVLITGASRGIGAATARLAGARGWNVTVNFLHDAAAASRTVAAVDAAGGHAYPAQGDMSVEADAIRVFDTALAAFGPIDGVVNNAGIVAPPCPVADMEAERMERIFRVNVLGAFLCAREASRRMATSRGGRGGAIVNISSAAARIGSPNEYVDYAASKGAVDTLTVGLSKELASEGVRVNGIRPGVIDTDIHASGGDPGKPSARPRRSRWGARARPRRWRRRRSGCSPTPRPT